MRAARQSDGVQDRVCEVKDWKIPLSQVVEGLVSKKELTIAHCFSMLGIWGANMCLGSSVHRRYSS